MKDRKINLVLANLWTFEAETPHFGLLSLAAYIRQIHPDINIQVVEGTDIAKKILKNQPDIIGFTGDTLMYDQVKNLAKKIRPKTKATFIIGGIHITAAPESLDPIFDLGVVGEGEKTFEEILDLYKRSDGRIPKDELLNVSGLVFFGQEGLVRTPKRELIKDIDSLPFPARDLAPIKEYYLKDQVNIFGVKREMTLMTSRGCPYRCVFCGSPVQWGRVRFHSAEYVVREIEYLVNEYKADGIMFWDDLFIAPEDRIIKMAELIKAKGLHKKVVFTGFARANLMNEKICATLAQINVKRLIFGLESGSEKILNYLKRSSVTVKDNRRAVELCRKYGISSSSGFIVGTPGETVDDLRDTYQFMRDYPLDNSQVYILTPYPGTEIWDRAISEKIIDPDIPVGKLFVQLPGPGLLDFFRSRTPDLMGDRIFLNKEYRNNQEYQDLIYKMMKTAMKNNLKFYLRIIPSEIGLILRIIWIRIKNFYGYGKKFPT